MERCDGDKKMDQRAWVTARWVTACWGIAFAFGLSFATVAQSWVLISGPAAATLPVTPESPVITFVWDGSAPSMSGIDQVLDGEWAGLTDSEVMENALNFAMNTWQVPGSFLKFRLEKDPSITIDPSDGKNAIVVKTSSNLAEAGFAAPTISKHTITDCDIEIDGTTTPLQDIIYTLIHEFGHCLGLGHTHTNYGTIMGYARISHSFHLGSDDMAGVIYLYPDPAYGKAEVQELAACSHGKHDEIASRRGRNFIAALFFLPFGLPIFYRRRRRRE
jgi:hypothetical protein